MGCCLSKKDPCSKSLVINNDNIPQTQQNDLKIAAQKLQINVTTSQIELQKREKTQLDENKEEEKEKEIAGIAVSTPKMKKEVFVIHHRKSNDKHPDLDGSGSVSNSSDPESIGRNLIAAVASGQVVRTSSCTKEEVDAILIQCGRLSRSNSRDGGNGRRYSGSKRSFDFDRENEGNVNGNEEGLEEEGRLRRRQSRGSSRERSGSKERVGGRRVSRSPGRRSDSPIGNGNGSNSGGSGNVIGNGKPGKLVSVPATVTSLSIDKSNNVNGGDNGSVKRVLVKRNVGSPRSQSPARGVNASGNVGRSQSPAKVNQVNGNGRSQSPIRGNQGSGSGSGNGNSRSQSPAKVNQVHVNGNGNGQQQGSVSRNGSRKAEHSPYRRTPLNEIDLNSLPFQPLANKRPLNKGKEIEEEGLVVKQPNNSVSQNKYATDNVGVKPATQGTHRRTRSRGLEGYELTKTNYCRVNDLLTPNSNQTTNNHEKDQLNAIEYDAMITPATLSGTETLNLSQKLVRSRSARRSRDFDVNVDALVTPSPATNYTSLLLQDIQNFHQKNSNPNGTSNPNSNTKSNTISLPSCVSKACSIVEAVADLNSTTRANPSFTFTDDRRVSPISGNFSFNSGKKRVDPFVESEVKIGDDLMEPSFHKYVTVRKRGGDMDDEESSGSNSIVGNVGHQNGVFSSSSWEPNSGDSTGCWTSKSYSREDEFSPAGFQRHTMSDIACGNVDDSGGKYSMNARDSKIASA